MDKIQIIEIEGVEHIIIDRGNNEFTSMLKSTYDAQQAAQAYLNKDTLASELSNPSTPQAGE